MVLYCLAHIKQSGLKRLFRDKHSSLFVLGVSDEEKKVLWDGSETVSDTDEEVTRVIDVLTQRNETKWSGVASHQTRADEMPRLPGMERCKI